jgi:hypothetical protein
MDLMGLKARPDPGGEHPGGDQEGGRMNQVVAYLELPGTRERYVITAGAQVVRITGAGELSVVGVVTDPGDTPFLCLIRTARLVLGVWSDGRLVDTASGVLLGRVVALGGAGRQQPGEPQAESPAEPESGPGGAQPPVPEHEKGFCPGLNPRLQPGEKPEDHWGTRRTEGPGR